MRRTTGRAGRRATLLITLLTGALGASVGPAAAAGHDPILLVHGWTGSPSTWQQTIDWFELEGRTAVAIDLASEDNVRNAAQIRDFIAAQGWSRVDIVAQSMGGLSSRWFIKKLGSSVVDSYVSLGTPQYGISAACLLPQSGGGQMCPSSRFLRDLNKGDDTPNARGPQPVFWTTIFSTTDGVVPVSSSRLDGGACHIQVPGPGHNEMDNDSVIFDHVLAAIDRTCTGEVR